LLNLWIIENNEMVASKSYKIKAWGIIALWSLFLSYDLVYRHYHYDNNGNLISHVHYYDKTSGDHQHTDKDFHWLDQMSNYHVVLDKPLIIEVFFVKGIEKPLFQMAYTEKIQITFLSSFFLRGPPVVIS